MSAPKISIIIPVYNADKWLRRCLDSILAQTYTDFELLLIDDGSKDNSGAICDEYAKKDSRIRVFHKSNGGVSSARNVGLDNAYGEWITFADADDFVFSNWLSNFKPEVEIYDLKCQGINTDKPFFEENDISGMQKYGVNFSGNIWELIESLFNKYILGYLFLKLFRSSIIKKHFIRFDTGIKLREDELFVLQFAQYADLAYSTSEIGYFYFVPNWGDKYKINFKETETLYKKQLICLQENSKENPYKESKSSLYRYLYKDLQFLYLFEFNNNRNRYYCLRNLRHLIIKDFSISYFSILTRTIIGYDVTGLFSGLYLRLLNLRNNAKKMN